MEPFQWAMSIHIELFIILMLQTVWADIQVFSRNSIEPVYQFVDESAAFGDPLPPKGITAFLVVANPEHACTSIDPPPRNMSNFTKHWAVLIKRSNCSYEDKVLAAQMATFDIAIVYNNESNELVKMSAKNPYKVYIPSVFVSRRTGLLLKEKYLYKLGYFILVGDDPLFDFTAMIIPFLLVISLCLTTLMLFIVINKVIKCIKDRRRAMRRRLPNSSLNKIPTSKFRKGDPYETCAICLDDYAEGDKLRILPCSHAYHCKCIDPWLTRNRRLCPMCKRKVFAEGEDPGASDSDSLLSDDDDHVRTPLIRTTQTTQGGTFSRVFAVSILNRARSSTQNVEQGDSSSSSIYESSSSRMGQTSRSGLATTPPSGSSTLESQDDIISERNEVVI